MRLTSSRVKSVYVSSTPPATISPPSAHGTPCCLHISPPDFLLFGFQAPRGNQVSDRRADRPDRHSRLFGKGLIDQPRLGGFRERKHLQPCTDRSWRRLSARLRRACRGVRGGRGCRGGGNPGSAGRRKVYLHPGVCLPYRNATTVVHRPCRAIDWRRPRAARSSRMRTSAIDAPRKIGSDTNRFTMR